jgi:hypothetical protein
VRHADRVSVREVTVRGQDAALFDPQVGVRYVDNETNLDARTLPVPSAPESVTFDIEAL